MEEQNCRALRNNILRTVYGVGRLGWIRLDHQF